MALESALASTTGTAQSGVLTHSEVGDFGQQRSRDLPQEGTNVPLLINEGVHRKEKEVDLDEALAMLAHCRTIDCIGAAHAAINGRTRFNAPHFFLIGFQKCATTSMVRHLDKHPQFLSSYIKEPHWWFICQKDLAAGMCKPNSTEDYISNYLRIQTAAEMRLEAATADTSADYAMVRRAWSTLGHCMLHLPCAFLQLNVNKLRLYQSFLSTHSNKARLCREESLWRSGCMRHSLG